MENPYAPPSARQSDDNLSADDVQLRANPPHPAPTEGVIGLAWEYVKQRPVETVLLGALSAFFGDGGCSTPNPQGIGDVFNTGDYEDSYDSGATDDYSDYDYLSDIDLQSVVETLPGADLLGLPNMLAQGGFGGGEMAIVGGVLAFVVLISLVFFVIGVALQAAEDIYWLRLIRGQNADLGLSFKVGRYILPIIVAQILLTLGVMFGLLLLIIPGIILSIGWMFVGKVVVDKNLGYVEALKASWRITDGYKLDLFVLSILTFFVALGGILACCIGLLAAMPVISGAFTIAYDRMVEPGNSYLEPGEDPGTGSSDDLGWATGPSYDQQPPSDPNDPYGDEW